MERIQGQRVVISFDFEPIKSRRHVVTFVLSRQYIASIPYLTQFLSQSPFIYHLEPIDGSTLHSQRRKRSRFPPEKAVYESWL